MKTASKICSCILSALLVLGTVSVSAAAEEYGDLEKDETAGFSYQKVDKDDDGKFDYIYIVEYYNQVADVVIPDVIDGLPVKEIGYGSFARSSNLTSVTMGKNVEVIADKAFMNCEALKTIKLSDCIKKVGRKAFTGSLWLDNIRAEKKPLIISGMFVDGVGCEGEVEIPDTVSEIRPYAFEGAVNVTQVNAESVVSIGEYAFNGCEKLKSITLSDTLASVEEGTFNGCSALTTIDVKNAGSIGMFAFSDCSSLETVYVKNKDCEIPESPYVFVNGYNEDEDPVFNGTIKGYTDSTAQAFAEKLGYKFVALDPSADPTSPTASTTPTTPTPSPAYIYGDVDLSGVVELADVTKLSKYLLSNTVYPLGGDDAESIAKAKEQADILYDGKIDTLDLSKLIEYNMGNIDFSDLGRK